MYGGLHAATNRDVLPDRVDRLRGRLGHDSTGEPIADAVAVGGLNTRLLTRGGRGEDVLYVYPLSGVVSGIACYAVVIPFAAVAGIL